MSEDAHFTTLLFDTWALFAAAPPAPNSAAPAAGRAINGGGAYPVTAPVPGRNGSVQELMGQGQARSGYSVRGPGQVMPSPAAYAGE